MKLIVIILAVLFVWIHFSPQAVFFYRAASLGNEYVEKGYRSSCTVEADWSWWSLRFYDIWPNCERTHFISESFQGAFFILM